MIRVATTPTGRFTPIGLYGERVHDMHQQLRAIVSARAEVTECGAIFAIPLIDADSGAVSWFTDAEGDVRAVSALPEAERVGLQQQIDRCVTAIQKVADLLAQSDKQSGRDNAERLRIALRHPAEDDWYVVGRQPVLVNWGSMEASSRTASEEIGRLGTVGVAAQPARPIAGTSPAGTRARSIIGWLGWLLALLVLAVLILMMLSRCSPRDFLGLDAQDGALSGLAEETRLRRDLGNLKHELDAARLACMQSNTCNQASKQPIDGSSMAPMVESWVDPAVPPISDDDICERIQETLDSCEAGDISVSLAWNSKDDLDLAIETHDGRVISWKNPEGTTGGKLNLDFNRELDKRSRRPVENISWPTADLPPGRYRILARLHDVDEGETQGKSIAYTATLSRRGETRAFTGQFVRTDEGKPWRVIGAFSVP